MDRVDKGYAPRHTGDVVPTEHGTPAIGGLLDVLWNDRREDAYDEGCRRA
jgi:hypothetical protein